MLYDYACPECGTVVELQRKMAESDDPVSCECGVQMKRKFAMPTVCFGLRGSRTMHSRWAQKEEGTW